MVHDHCYSDMLNKGCTDIKELEYNYTCFGRRCTCIGKILPLLSCEMYKEYKLFQKVTLI